LFHWHFRLGTALAERSFEYQAASCGVRSFAMLFALGAASSVWDALQSLATTKSSSAQSAGQTATNPFDLNGSTAPAGSSAPASGTGSWSPISPETMSALIAAQSQSTSTGATSTSATATSSSDALKDLFSQIDANGDGQISKSEFETALGAGGTNVAQADNVFSKLDKSGDGNVSLDEMKSALQGAGGRHGHHHHAEAAASSGDSSSADGTTSASASSNDALMQALDAALDSSAKNNAASATPSYNAVQQMIQRGVQTPAASVSSVSVNA